MMGLGPVTVFVALQQYHCGLGENIEPCDEHTPGMARPPRIESFLHGNSHKHDARDLEAP